MWAGSPTKATATFQGPKEGGRPLTGRLPWLGRQDSPAGMAGQGGEDGESVPRGRACWLGAWLLEPSALGPSPFSASSWPRGLGRHLTSLHLSSLLRDEAQQLAGAQDSASAVLQGLSGF